jgi:hypothetical protein
MDTFVQPQEPDEYIPDPEVLEILACEMHDPHTQADRHLDLFKAGIHATGKHNLVKRRRKVA